MKPSLLCLSCLLAVPAAPAQSLTAARLSRIAFDQKLGAQVSLSLPFRDEDGRDVRLSQFLGRKPVILMLGYYECPMLCTLTLNGMVESLEDVKWTIGSQFDVLSVSINPRESPRLAAAKKANYLRRYGRTGAGRGWHFLTGEQPAIDTLAEEVGFHYAYDPALKQYAHPAGLVILTPEGRVAKYLFGVTFSPHELFAALQGASGNHVGSRIQQLVLLCFSHSPLSGKYGPTIVLTLRILAGATLAALAGLLLSLLHRETHQPASGAAVGGSPAPQAKPLEVPRSL